MAKKFGKALLFTAAAVSAAAAFYFYLQKKEAAQEDSEEEDYDDFSEEPEDDTESSRSYVPLNHETSAVNSDENAQNQEKVEEFPIDNSSDTNDSSSEKTSEDAFTPLTQQVAQAADNAAEAVEDFFDEEDGPGVEPPITDN